MPVTDNILNHYPEVISAIQSERFDSHTFIDKLIELHKALYDAHVNEYSQHGDEREKFAHLTLSQALHKFPHLVQPDGKAVSMNVKGYKSENSNWKKVR